ncbi:MULTISPECIES: SCO5918 family protein [Streptomyces]|uniref:SCO5918 family protein n=1 Tax=Streptomyces heilongjiangensis TaxID=945052 RepID=A0ABW1BAL3_9ACTN|nr:MULTISPECIES: SCO5918 family protein [Streptomyces]MDC2946267.1 SCO5918 family protein [Streptomyces heilongjiangensis]
MRCVIARFPFDLTKSEVEQSLNGVAPEPVAGTAVTVNRQVYSVMQVGEVITGQNRRDFTAGEMRRALTRLGFACHDTAPVAQAAPAWSALGDEGASGW